MDTVTANTPKLGDSPIRALKSPSLTLFFINATGVGIMVNSEVEDNKYSKELCKGWKEARYNGLWSVEVDLLRIIEGKGWR
jgi:hypothetical protein